MGKKREQEHIVDRIAKALGRQDDGDDEAVVVVDALVREKLGLRQFEATRYGRGGAVVLCHDSMHVVVTYNDIGLPIDFHFYGVHLTDFGRNQDWNEELRVSFGNPVGVFYNAFGDGGKITKEAEISLEPGIEGFGATKSPIREVARLIQRIPAGGWR